MKYKETMFDLPMLIDKLEAAANDLEVTYPNENFDIVLVGGSALMLLNISEKVTNDIDVFTLSDRKIIPILERHYMNTMVNAYSDSFSSDMEERYSLITHLKCKNVRYFTCCLEDLVASKLGAYREKDINDISNIEVLKRINISLLDKIIYEELKIDYLVEKRYKELIDHYSEYRKIVLDVQEEKS